MSLANIKVFICVLKSEKWYIVSAAHPFNKGLLTGMWHYYKSQVTKTANNYNRQCEQQISPTRAFTHSGIKVKS